MVISHGWLDNLPWSMDQSYLHFLGISPLGPQQPFMTPWTETFGLDSKYTTHRSRRCCWDPFWPLECDEPSAQQSSSECWPPDMLQTPGRKNLRVFQVFNVYMSEVCLIHMKIQIYIYIYLHMNIYDHIWRIYIIYEYGIRGGCFHEKKNQRKK